MINRVMIRSLAVCGLCAFVPQIATAAPISFMFKGVTISQPDGVTTPFDGGTFEAVVTFDSQTADINPGDPQSGVYHEGITGGYLAIETPTSTYRWDIDPAVPFTNEILVQATSLADFIEFGPGLSGPSVAGLGTPTYFLLQLWDDTASTFSSDAMPTNLAISDFTRSNLQLTFAGSCCASLGTITEVSRVHPAPVPEPSSMVLLGSGVVLAMIRRRLYWAR
jgi:hypothetical protein